MSDTFLVNDISFSAEDLEQLGTKEKFWFRFADEPEQRWLFKYSRANTGEHWSEKVAEQLCLLLGIPHSRYELAWSEGRPGIVTANIVPTDFRMVMGNEVLHASDPGTYPRTEGDKPVRVREHTVSRVLGCLDREVQRPKGAVGLDHLNAGDIFCGYLLLDALISNQDRHHENWAIMVDNRTAERFLCPTYDHAASLGRELRDSEREERLNTKDRNRTVGKFVTKARSELFRLKTDKKPLLTIDAFFAAVEKRDAAKRHWLEQLDKVDECAVAGILARIPKELITDTAGDFAVQMVLENRKRLIEHESK